MTNIVWRLKFLKFYHKAEEKIDKVTKSGLLISNVLIFLQYISPILRYDVIINFLNDNFNDPALDAISSFVYSKRHLGVEENCTKMIDNCEFYHKTTVFMVYFNLWRHNLIIAFQIDGHCFIFAHIIRAWRFIWCFFYQCSETSLSIKLNLW